MDTQARFAASHRDVRVSLRRYQIAAVSERRRYYQEVWSQQHRGDNEPFPPGPGFRHRMSRIGLGPLPTLEQLASGGPSSDTPSTGPMNRIAA